MKKIILVCLTILALGCKKEAPVSKGTVHYVRVYTSQGRFEFIINGQLKPLTSAQEAYKGDVVELNGSDDNGALVRGFIYVDSTLVIQSQAQTLKMKYTIR